MGIVQWIKKGFVRKETSKGTHMVVYDHETLSYLVVENSYFNREIVYKGSIHEYGTKEECEFSANCLNME